MKNLAITKDKKDEVQAVAKEANNPQPEQRINAGIRP